MFIYKKKKEYKILNLCIGGLTPSVGSIVTEHYNIITISNRFAQ